MSKIFGKRTASKLVMAAAGAVGLMGMAQQAGATLSIAVRTNTGASSATVTNGQTINLFVYAQVQGTDTVADDDWLQSVYGTFQSTGALKGNLAGFTGAGPGGVYTSNGWTANGGEVATSGDFDSDGDTDFGDPSDYTKMFYARNAQPEGPSLDEQTDLFGNKRSPQRWAPVPGGPAGDSQILLGVLTFTATDATGSSTINYSPRIDPATGHVAQEAALWWEDDIPSTGGTGPSSTDPNNPSVYQKDGLSGILQAASPFIVNSVPEPASLSVLALASLGLLKRRRRENI